MKDWLKFFFLGFFNDKLAEEGAKRSGFNTLLSFVLAFLLLCGGLTAGYSASFSGHYSDAELFRSFLYSAFAGEDGSGRISAEVENGRLTATFGDGRTHVNGFTEEDGFEGYTLVVDTRPASTTFDDFSVVCKDAEGRTIGYEDYRILSEEDKKKGSFKIEYSGKTLDVMQKQGEYTAFLDRVSEEGSEDYNEEIAKAYASCKAEEMGTLEYANAVYTLFVRAYYPSLKAIETYGDAPTVKTYYMEKSMSADVENYIVLLDDLAVCSFVTPKGIRVDFGGYYSDSADFVISADGLTAEQIRENVDSFVTRLFKDSGGLNFFIYVVNVFKVILLLAVVMLVFSLLMFLAGRLAKTGWGYFGSFKIMGAFLTVDAVVSFITAFTLSFFVPRQSVYAITEAVFIGLLIGRTVLFAVAEIIRKLREKPEEKHESEEAIFKD